MGIFGKLFSKQTCAICGKEVGALSRTKLKDGNYICSDCRKNASRLFRLGYHDLEATKKHLEYMEKANELYEKEFAPLIDKDEVDYCHHHGSHKIGFADSIGMFEIISPEMKKSSKKELFRYDQIDSFGPYYNVNSSSGEGQKKYSEYGVLIKMRCAEDFAQMKASEKEKALMHPYAIELKIPIQHNVDNPSGGDRIFSHLATIFGGKDSDTMKAANSVASVLLGAPTATMIPFADFSGANRAKYTKLADEVEKRALGRTLRGL